MGTPRKELRSTLDVRDIPDGWVRLSSFGAKTDVRYHAVYSALHNGQIGAHECIKFKLTDEDPRGPIYVCPQAADRAIKAAADYADVGQVKPSSGKANSRQVEAAVVALCEINNGLSVIGDTLRDLVAAVQLLGEQQGKQAEPIGTWRDMNGEAL